MFEVGYEFETTCIFTGGTHQYKVVSRTKDELRCLRIYNEIDGIHKGKEVFEIHKEDGREYIILWKYAGDEGRHYAPETEEITEEIEDEYPCFGCQKASQYNCKHCKYGDDGNYSVYDVYTPAELGIKVTW